MRVAPSFLPLAAGFVCRLRAEEVEVQVHLLIRTWLAAGGELDITARDGVEDVEEAVQLGGCVGGGGGGLDGGNKGPQTVEVCLVVGLDYPAKDDDKGNKRGK